LSDRRTVRARRVTSHQSKSHWGGSTTCTEAILSPRPGISSPARGTNTTVPAGASGVEACPLRVPRIRYYVCSRTFYLNIRTACAICSTPGTRGIWGSGTY
jgi:hypothetical protein